MRHIAVNTRLFLPNRIEGIGRVGYEILKRMVNNHPETQFTFLFDRKYSEEFVFARNVHPKVVFPPSRHPLLWYLGFHFTLPYVLSQLKPDVFYSFEPYLTSHPTLPQVPVFHDIDYEYRPHDIGKRAILWYYQKYFPRYAHQATQIISVSEYTRQNLMRDYQASPEKISVIHNGCAEVFTAISEEEKQRTRIQFTNGRPYFYFVGAMQPRKNVENLLLAFDLFKETYASDIQLLLVGRMGWKTQETEAIFSAMKHKNSVSFTGYVSDSELNRISAASIALCFVSFLEGFGIPALEAMYSEAPVIASRGGALPEVCGEAAYYVNPESPDSILQGLLQLAKDDNYRLELIQKGRQRRTEFSWDKAAAQTWEVLERATRHVK